MIISKSSHNTGFLPLDTFEKGVLPMLPGKAGSPHKIRVVIFDVDGTLVNSMPMWHGIDYEYADLKGFTMPPELCSVLDGMCLEQCAAYYRDVFGVPGTVEEIIAEIVGLAREKYRTEVPEVPGAAAFVRALRAHGIRTAVATASDLDSLWPALERLGIAPYIDAAESCATIGKSKEVPDIYIKCASDFGAEPEECVVFEDALYAAQTAKNAGFSVVGVLDPEQPVQERAAFLALCDRCIPDYTALLGELLPPEDGEHAL